MIEVEFLTVAEFAALAGVSKQNIYKQVHNKNSRLSPYVMRRGKAHLIKAEALEVLYGVETTYTNEETTNGLKETAFTTEEGGNEEEKTTQKAEETTLPPPNNQPTANFSTQEEQTLSTDYIQYLKNQITELKKEKAESEERLNTAIQEKDRIIKDQSAQLADLARQVAEIANKALITTSQQQYLSAAEKAEKQETIEQETEEKKKSLFKRLFR